MKTLLSAAAAALALTALAGCGDDDETPSAEDTVTPASSDATEPAEEPTVGSYPELAATDYTYVLEQICYCPLTGPVKVTVEDGEVTSAVLTQRAPGMKKGSEAPEYLWVSLNDVIAKANDTGAASVEVEWPDGQDWPDRVEVDQIENATDDEVTYLVRDVQVS